VAPARRSRWAPSLRTRQPPGPRGRPPEEFAPEGLARLAASLRTKGQLAPIRVRWDEAAERYVIVCGERRWRAAEIAGLPSLSCVVMEGPADPGELLALQLVENCVREDLRPIEQARAFRALVDRNAWTVRQLADELNISHVSVVRALALLDLPAPVQDRVEVGDLPAATAYEISKVPDPAAQAELAREAVAGRLKRDEIRERARPKGRGGSKVTSRVLKTPGGRVTVELKRGEGDRAIRETLAEALAQMDARLAEDDREAA
jgi:ParB family chromosome partitioning protein